MSSDIKPQSMKAVIIKGKINNNIKLIRNSLDL